MKRIIPFIVLIMLSCSKNEEETPGTTNPKEYTVQIGLSGEILDIENSQLQDRNSSSEYTVKSASTSSNDRYEMKVLSKSTQEEDYSAYAYGMFDNVDNLKIKLIEGHLYRFACELIVDAKDKLENLELTDINNTLDYVSPDKYLPDGHGSIYMRDGKSYYCPSVDIFFGVTTNYVANSNESVNINMKRVAFGIKVISNEFNEGRLKITIADAPPLYINAGETSVQDIFALQPDSNLGSWTDDNGNWTDDGTQKSQVSIIWIKNNEEEVPIASKIIDFYRNTLTTITVNVSDNTNAKSFSINRETSPMIEGETIVIN